MLTLPPSVRIYLAIDKVDMRCGHDGLGAIVRNQWRLDIFEGHLFVFVGRKGDRLKDPVLGPRRLRPLLQAPRARPFSPPARDGDGAHRRDGRDRARHAARRDRRQPGAPAREMGTASSGGRRRTPASLTKTWIKSIG
jgi:transposase